MSRMHLAIITPGFPDGEDDTACIPALADFVLALKKYAPDIRISIFALAYPFDRGRFEWHGLEVHSVGRANPSRSYRVAAHWRLWRALRQSSAAHGKFTAVHSFWLGSAALLGHAFARIFGCHHVVTLMGQELRFSLLYKPLLVSPRLTAVAIGARQRDFIAGRVPEAQLTVIPFGLDRLPVEPVPAAGRQFDLAFVGSLAPVKQPLLFLDVMARLGSQVTAVMVGDGPLRGAVEARIAELGLGERITLAGYLPREDALQLLAQARVLLHTSAFEGGPAVLDEALALGVAVAIRPVGKAADGPGCIVADGVEGLAEAASRLLAAPPPAPRLAHDLRETVASYRRLYAD